MAKQKNSLKNSSQLLRSERLTLIISTATNTIFILLVTVAFNGLLSLYVVPHLVVTVSAYVILTGNDYSSTLKRVVLISSVLGAIVAVLLILGFLPWYISYLNSRGMSGV